MKKKNLFLSLICSLILTAALVTFTVISLVPKKDAGNNGQISGSVSDNVETQDPNLLLNEDRDGSAEKPYVIYSAEAFNTFVVGKYLDEEGKYVDYNAVNDAGELVYPELNAGLHYELSEDIDFGGAEVVPFFNEGIAFNGYIDGQGHILKNININVTKANLISEFSYVDDEEFIANVGLFGELNGAEIKNVTLDAVNVTFEEGLYSYIWSAEFDNEFGTMKSITVGSLAGIAQNSVIEATVNANIDAFAYSVYVENKADGMFALGGLVGATNLSSITNSTVNANIEILDGSRYYVGGAIGCAFDTTFTASKVSVNILANYDRSLYVAGAIGYANAITVEDVKVELTVNEATENHEMNTNGVTSVVDNSYVWVSGVVARIDANKEAKESLIKNVDVKSDVKIDAIFAGVVMDIMNLEDVEGKTVSIIDVIADSNVRVLKAYGIARRANDTVISLNRYAVDLVNEKEVEYNIRLTGDVRLDSYSNINEGVRLYPASITVVEGAVLNGGNKTLKVIVSALILTDTKPTEQLRPVYGSIVVV